MDAIIITQAYHALDSLENFKAIRDALHDEDGTLGLVWHRAPAGESWSKAFTEAAAKQLQGAYPAGAADRLPSLEAGETPMTWVERCLPAQDFHMKTLKHRKYVERVTGPLVQLVPQLMYTSDLRFAGSPSLAADAGKAQAAFAAGVKAAEAQVAKEQAEGGQQQHTSDCSLSFDLHSFHTSVMSTKITGKKWK